MESYEYVYKDIFLIQWERSKIKRLAMIWVYPPFLFINYIVATWTKLRKIQTNIYIV